MNRAPVFAVVREIVREIDNRGLTAGEIERLDDAFDAGEGITTPDAPSAPEARFTPQHIGAQGIALIKSFEGCERKRADGKFDAYPDPASGGDPWTIGWGSTGPNVTRGTVWTQAQCDAEFVRELVEYADDVKRALGSALPRTSQAQFDALVSFHYNTGSIESATLTAKHKAGEYAAAAAQFDRWTRAGGRVMAGLTRRRAAEAALYRSGS